MFQVVGRRFAHVTAFDQALFERIGHGNAHRTELSLHVALDRGHFKRCLLCVTLRHGRHSRLRCMGRLVVLTGWRIFAGEEVFARLSRNDISFLGCEHRDEGDFSPETTKVIPRKPYAIRLPQLCFVGVLHEVFRSENKASVRLTGD